MKILVLLFSLFYFMNAAAQVKDSVYVNKQKKLVLKSAPNPSDRSLVRIDGKVYNGKLEDIDKFSIDHFEVMSAGGALNVFGEAGKNGAVLFTMINQGRLKVSTDRFKSIAEFIKAKNPLVVINRIPYKGSIEAISPYSIQNVDILNAKEAIARFGETARSGAVVMNTSQIIDNTTGLLK